jgi:hypothetical protein
MSCRGTSGTSSAKTTAKPLRLARQHNSTTAYRRRDHARAQVPIYVAVEEPRARVVREEPDRDIISSVADAHDVADNGVHEVVRRIATTADHVKRMTVKVNGMLLEKDQSKVSRLCRHAAHSQVRRRHRPEWSIRRSCSVRDRRCSQPVVDLTGSSHRSGSGATRVQWGAHS